MNRQKYIGLTICISILVVLLAAIPLLGKCYIPKITSGDSLSKDKADAIISVEQGYYNSHLPLFATKIELIENTEDYLLYRVYYFPFGSIERSYARDPDGNWIFNLEKPLFGIS